MGALSGLKLVKDGHKIKVEQNIKWKLAVGCFICLVKESIDSKILSRCYQWFVEVVSLQRVLNMIGRGRLVWKSMNLALIFLRFPFEIL